MNYTFMLKSAVFIFLCLFIFSCTGKQDSPKTDLFALDKFVTLYKVSDAVLIRLMYRNENIYNQISINKDSSLLKKNILELQARGKILRKKIGFVKAFLFQNIGGELDEKKYLTKNLVEIEKVEAYMIGIDKDGKGYEIEKDLDEFVDFLNKNFKSLNPQGFTSPTQLNYFDHAVYEEMPELKKMDFVNKNFKNTPNAAALAILVQLQLQVCLYEGDLLENYRKSYNGL